MPPKPKFQDGERVLCFHGPLMYEAKTIRYEVKEKTIKYLVHYNGWNKSWDEWVPETRVLKFGEASLQKQRELKKSHEAKLKSTKAANKTKKEKADAAAAAAQGESEKDEKSQKGRKEPKERSGTPTVDKKKGETTDKRKGPKDKHKPDKDKDKDKDEDWEKGSTKSEEGSASGSRKRARANKDKGNKGDKDKDKDTEPQSKKGKKEEKEQEKKEQEKKEQEKIEQEKKEQEKEEEEKELKDKENKDKELKEKELKEKEKKEEEEGLKKNLKRIRGEGHVEMEECFLTKIEVKIKIPDELKPWLVDDWDLITRQKQLVNIPCKNNVETILDDYVKSKETKGPHPQRDAILEVIQGIKDYFNVMLGSQLLFKFERAQYSEVLADHPDKTMSQMYGAVHLLRLFVRLGSMLAYTPLDEKSMQLLLSHIHDFIKYMSKNSQNLFNIGEYVVAPPEYHRKAM